MPPRNARARSATLAAPMLLSGCAVTVGDAGTDHGLGPLVAVVVDDMTTMVGATSFADGDDTFAAWLVGRDGSIRAVEVAASRLTDYPSDAVDTAGEGPTSHALAEAMDCSWIATDAAGLRPEPEPVEPELRPDLMAASPDPATAGTLVDLTFPDETPGASPSNSTVPPVTPGSRSPG